MTKRLKDAVQWINTQKGPCRIRDFAMSKGFRLELRVYV